jgi:hypothetical protein
VPFEDTLDRIGDGTGVDDCAVDDRIGRYRLGAEGRDLVALAGGLQLDSLDGARSDVESDNRFGLCEQRHVSSGVTVELGNRYAVEHVAAAPTNPSFQRSRVLTNLQTAADSCEGDLPKRAVVFGYRPLGRPHHVNSWNIRVGTWNIGAGNGVPFFADSHGIWSESSGRGLCKS